MFTGIVQSLGTILAADQTPAGKRLTVSLAELAVAPISPSDSICISGVCLTVVKIANDTAHFDVITETLKRSTLGSKKNQDRVNLELSLRGDSFVGGHFVQGHADAIATVTAISQDPRDWRITFQIPPEVIPFIVPKGSVSVDGVSMTIAEVHQNRFTLAVIPTTLEKTTLGTLRIGDSVNVETDILARTVVHYLQQIRNADHSTSSPFKTALIGSEREKDPGITMTKLRELGLA